MAADDVDVPAYQDHRRLPNAINSLVAAARVAADLHAEGYAGFASGARQSESFWSAGEVAQPRVYRPPSRLRAGSAASRSVREAAGMTESIPPQPVRNWLRTGVPQIVPAWPNVP